MELIWKCKHQNKGTLSKHGIKDWHQLYCKKPLYCNLPFVKHTWLKMFGQPPTWNSEYQTKAVLVHPITRRYKALFWKEYWALLHEVSKVPTYIYCLYIYIHIYLGKWKSKKVIDIIKKEFQAEFFQKFTFLTNVSRFKARYKRTVRFTQFIVQVGMTLCEKKKPSFLQTDYY